MSLPIDDIITILRDGGHLTDPKALQAAARDLIAAEKEVKESKEPAVKTKTRLSIVIQGTDELKQLVAGGAYVLSVPDDDSVADTYMGEGLIGRIATAARAHNDAPRGRRKSKRVIKTLNDAMTGLRVKVIKQSGSQFSIRGKGQPVEVVVVTAESIV